MLRGIVDSIYRVQISRGMALAERVFFNNDLLLKWTINFVSLLTLTGGGQRPQVYCYLQLPTSQMLSRFERAVQFDNEGFIELHTTREKTTRALDMPHVLLASRVLPFLLFHLQVVRPLVMKGSSKSHDSRTTLVHTQRAVPLTMEDVR